MAVGIANCWEYAGEKKSKGGSVIMVVWYWMKKEKEKIEINNKTHDRV